MDFSLVKEHPYAAVGAVVVGGGALFLLLHKSTGGGTVPTPVIVNGGTSAAALQYNAMVTSQQLQSQTQLGISHDQLAAKIAAYGAGMHIQDQLSNEKIVANTQGAYAQVSIANQKYNSQNIDTYQKYNTQNNEIGQKYNSQNIAVTQSAAASDHAQDAYQTVSIARANADRDIAMAGKATVTSPAAYTQPTSYVAQIPVTPQVFVSPPAFTQPVQAPVPNNPFGSAINGPYVPPANLISLLQNPATSSNPVTVSASSTAETSWLKSLPQWVSDGSTPTYGVNNDGSWKTYSQWMAGN